MTFTAAALFAIRVHEARVMLRSVTPNVSHPTVTVGENTDDPGDVGASPGLESSNKKECSHG